MMLIKKITRVLAGLGFTVMASASQAVYLDGTIDVTTGAMGSLLPSGAYYTGYLEWDAGTITSGYVILGGFCFTDDAAGQPPSSPTCGSSLSAVPILTTGQTSYDGTPATSGSTFQQAGSTFDGNSGVINLLAYSPSFNTLIPITLNISSTFDDEFLGNTGTIFVDAGSLGTACGSSFGGGSCEVVPVPAAAWLFGSALLGLAGIKRQK